MFSRLFSVNFTRSIYTNSKKVLIYDISLRLPYLVSKARSKARETGGEEIQVLVPCESEKEIARDYRQGKNHHFADYLNKSGSTIDYAKELMEDKRYGVEKFETFVLHELILGKRRDGSTRPLDEIGPHVQGILKAALQNLKHTQEFHVTLSRSEYKHEENWKKWDLVKKITSDEDLKLMLITVKDKDDHDQFEFEFDYDEEKKQEGRYADDGIKMKLIALKFRRAYYKGEWKPPVAADVPGENDVADGPGIVADGPDKNDVADGPGIVADGPGTKGPK